MDPNQAPCHLCADMPCAQACPTDALTPLPPSAVSGVIFLGLAHVETERCFVFQGPECGACHPACPLGAITLSLGRPRIDAELCNGCGLCRASCPVWGKAIRIDLAG